MNAGASASGLFVVRASDPILDLDGFRTDAPPSPPVSAPAQSGRWRRALTPTLFAGFGAIVFILIATLAVGLRHLRQVHATSEAVAHTYCVKLALQQLLTRLVDADTGERGYIITNEAGYLQPYNGARQRVVHDIAEIRKLSADFHEHGADLERLSRAVELKLGGAGLDDTNTP